MEKPGQVTLWLDEKPRDGPTQMAIDELMLGDAEGSWVRLYRWDGAWVSFGHFQSLAEARGRAGSRNLVRRWTGGGYVSHTGDLTFSVAVPAENRLAGSGIRESYRSIHDALRMVLLGMGIEVELAGRGRAHSHFGAAENRAASCSCFERPVLSDLVDADGRKLAGGAQRRTRDGFLYQGSLQLGDIDWSPAWRRRFAASLCKHLFPDLAIVDAEDLDRLDRLVERARRLARTRYASSTWLGKTP